MTSIDRLSSTAETMKLRYVFTNLKKSRIFPQLQFVVFHVVLSKAFKESHVCLLFMTCSANFVAISFTWSKSFSFGLPLISPITPFVLCFNLP